MSKTQTKRTTDADPTERPIDQVGNLKSVPPTGTVEDPKTEGALVVTGADAVTLPLKQGGTVTLQAGEALPKGVTLDPAYAHLFGPAATS